MSQLVKSIVIWPFIVTLFFALPVRAEILDRIVATVNGDIITLQEVNQRLDIFMKSKGAPTDVDMTVLKREVVSMLIDQKLTLQEGERLMIKVSEEEIDETIERVKKQNGLTDKMLKQELAGQGMDIPTLRNDIRVDLTKSKIIRFEIGAHTLVTEEEIDQYLGSGGSVSTTSFQRDEPYDTSGKVRLKNILFNLPEKPDKAAIELKKKQVEKVYKELEKGMDFSEAARKYSEGANASQGGDLGLIALDDMAEQIASAIRRLKPGQITPPIVTGQGIQVFQLVGKEEASARKTEPKKEKKEQPARVDSPEREEARRALAEQKVRSRYETWLKNVRAKALIEINL